MSRSLVNLIAEIEHRLRGDAPTDRLADDLGERIPSGESYVLCLFDGLGAAQVRDHGHDFERAMVATLDAPFPATTTVALASVATGLAATGHGIIGHHMRWPELDAVINVLKWIYPGGDLVDYDTIDVLPSPNLWERLAAAGIEPITVQPAAFERSPLTRMLYRGCRVEPVTTEREMAEATIQLAEQPNRFVFTYFPHIDIAAHISGRASSSHAAAVRAGEDLWTSISNRLPAGAVMVGTADHGHIDYTSEQKVLLSGHSGVEFYGDPRALYVRGDGASVAGEHGARWLPLREFEAWLGNGSPHPELSRRLPDGVILARDGQLLIPRNMDRRLVGYHGGIATEEREIPLLIGSS